MNWPFSLWLCSCSHREKSPAPHCVRERSIFWGAFSRTNEILLMRGWTNRETEPKILTERPRSEVTNWLATSWIWPINMLSLAPTMSKAVSLENLVLSISWKIRSFWLQWACLPSGCQSVGTEEWPLSLPLFCCALTSPPLCELALPGTGHQGHWLDIWRNQEGRELDLWAWKEMGLGTAHVWGRQVAVSSRGLGPGGRWLGCRRNWQYRNLCRERQTV